MSNLHGDQSSPSSVYIEYDSLLAGKDSLDSLYDEVHPTYVNRLTPLYEELLTLDDDHENCFSDEEENLYAINDSMTQTAQDIDELSLDISFVCNEFMEAELSIMENLDKIDSDTKYACSELLKAQLGTILDSDGRIKPDSINIGSKGLGIALINQNYEVGGLQKIHDNKNPVGPLSHDEYERQSEIVKKLVECGKTEREKAVIYATYIATLYPNQLEYFWGGGHGLNKEELMGIDFTWGDPKLVTSQGDETTGTEQPNSMDCSGYVVRSLVNGGYNKLPSNSGAYDINVAMLQSQGTTVPITELKDVQAGDLVSVGSNEHVGIVIDVNEKTNTITTAHSSGSGGMNLTTIDSETGKVLDDSNDKSRVGKIYWTNSTKLTYDDE